MNTPGAVVKIFWPVHVCSPQTLPGFLVGWNVRNFTVCVAAVISDVKLRDLEATLSALSTDNRSSFVYMSDVCGAPPIVLGVLTVDSNDVDTENILHAEGVSLEIIFYKQPNPTLLQYLSLEPLVLDISKNNNSTKSEQESTTVKNMKKITSTRIRSSRKEKSHVNDLDLILNQVNSSYETEKAVRARCKAFQTRRNRRSASVSETVKKSAVGLGIFLKKILMYPILFLAPLIRPTIAQPILFFLVLVRVFAEIVLWILNVRFPNWLLNGISLKDLSATAQQIDLRLQQACFWPWQFMLQRRRDWTNIATTRAQYISFHNSMWLVANDIIIGVAIGFFLMDNNEAMAKLIMDDYLNHYTMERLEKMIIWLMGWPAGLKLNSELDKFLGELFLWLILLWKGCITNIEPMVPIIIRMIGLSGMLGASMVLSLLSDFLSFMTIHIYSFYMVAARIFNWQLTILYSLFNLFQGKKWNTLRNRIDSCDYALDQLLLGTILFTLLTFLFPTIVVYYATFALSRVGVIFLQAVMETLLAFFNHFPLFAIMLRFSDPERLPGGLRFEKCDPDYFATYEMPLARVFKGLKSFWPWTTISSKKPVQPLNNDNSKISNSTSDTATTSMSQIQEDTNKNQIIRRRKSRVTIAVNGAPSSHSILSQTSNTLLPATPLLSLSSIPKVSYLFLHNLPIPLSAIFFQYMLLWKRLSSHYFSLYVLRGLVSGKTIRPIPRLQYPMLPETRQANLNGLLVISQT
ncbi:11642_t:CDS:10 [Ambispora leptoticha]|uniref:11642_t:CDS:1 n=1 Tax=Ambispora leptoticha TaxID=144679 RepID=A0A9N9C7R6_9GLOM|nr:11642_t:CDS:10 [Ambispora leptoticha]